MEKSNRVEEKFILKYSWFVLNYFFKTLGLGLLKKDGKGGLKQTSACQFWLHWTCTNAVISFSMTVTFFYILIVETTPEDYIAAMNEKLYASAINIFAAVSNFTMVLGINYIGIFKLRTLSGELVGIQDYFKQNALIDEQATKKSMKTFFFTIFPNMAIIFIGLSLCWIGANTLIFSMLDVPILCIIMLSIFCSLFLFFCLAPIFWFFFIYTEVIYCAYNFSEVQIKYSTFKSSKDFPMIFVFQISIRLSIWCQSISKSDSTSLLLYEAKLFIDRLNEVVVHFSSILFWIIPLFMVNVIVMSYLSIIQLLNSNGADEKIEWERKMVSVSYGVLAFGNFCLIFHLCHVSENLAVTTGKLEKFIIDDLMENGDSQHQNAVCSLLSKFKGFNANGYFTINHSMLTGLIASLVTYLVILVELKQSGDQSLISNN